MSGDDKKTEFERAGAHTAEQGIVSEFLAFLKQNKKWWMLPIVAIILLFGLLLILAGTGAAPFLYSLF